ncbi:MAG: hypothetical protein K0R57_2084 [Paenibacillaceae bacterium]|jgi:hypothetical protein|nr:hypothetical protein [Paenibacillaceae bacterium]
MITYGLDQATCSLSRVVENREQCMTQRHEAGSFFVNIHSGQERSFILREAGKVAGLHVSG